MGYRREDLRSVCDRTIVKNLHCFIETAVGLAGALMKRSQIMFFECLP